MSSSAVVLVFLGIMKLVSTAACIHGTQTLGVNLFHRLNLQTLFVLSTMEPPKKTRFCRRYLSEFCLVGKLNAPDSNILNWVVRQFNVSWNYKQNVFEAGYNVSIFLFLFSISF